MEYFRARREELLIKDIIAGERWQDLCPFLGDLVPPLAFPCSNARARTA